MQRLIRLTKDTWERFNTHGDVLAAGMSFYALLSVAPLLVIALTIAGWVFDQQRARDVLMSQLDRLGSPDLKTTAMSMIDSAHANNGKLAAILAAVILLIAASRLFLQVQDALNMIWGVRVKSAASVRETITRLGIKRLMSFAMVLGCGALLLVTIVLQTVSVALANLAQQAFGNNFFTSAFALGMQTSVALGLGSVAFAIVYRVLPDVRLGWSDVWVGALLTSGLMLIGTWLLSLYLSHVAPAWLQGAIGSLAVFMVWTYYQAQVFLLGAAFTRAWSCRHGSLHQPEPTPLAERGVQAR